MGNQLGAMQQFLLVLAANSDLAQEERMRDNIRKELQRDMEAAQASASYLAQSQTRQIPAAVLIPDKLCQNHGGKF